jgi:glutathione S-transferase
MPRLSNSIVIGKGACVKLFMVGASPYARKVRAAAAERGILDRITPVMANPHQRPEALVAANPLSKVPTLIADDGTVHVDSFAIALYLDTIGEAPLLVPADGSGRWRVIQRHALADGVMDCSVTRRVESQKTQEPDRVAWMNRQLDTTKRVLDRFESTVESFADEVALDTLTLACALSYLDFRFPQDGWRDGRPQLTAWHREFEKRQSMQVTQFHE